MNEIETRINQLVDIIEKANDDYWKRGTASITDIEYDNYVKELQAVCPNHPILLKVMTPAVCSSGKVNHTRPMLSMMKVYSIEKLIAWINRYKDISPIIAMPKYDGIALVKYDNGTVSTRGNGTTGENVTYTANIFIPKDVKGYGEAVVLDKDFAILREQGYNSQRNAVSGIFNTIDPKFKELAKYLTFISYNSYQVEIDAKNINAAKLFDVINSIKTACLGIPLDGIVFSIKNLEVFEKLGYTKHHWRGQIAYKFANETFESYIEKIIWNVTNGTVTPIALLKPINCNGINITRATLHNFKRVEDYDVRVGDQCIVEYAGGVIPKLIQTRKSLLSKESRTEIPKTCPICNTTLQIDGHRLFCEKCKDQK